MDKQSNSKQIKMVAKCQLICNTAVLVKSSHIYILVEVVLGSISDNRQFWIYYVLIFDETNIIFAWSQFIV